MGCWSVVQAESGRFEVVYSNLYTDQRHECATYNAGEKSVEEIVDIIFDQGEPDLGDYISVSVHGRRQLYQFANRRGAA